MFKRLRDFEHCQREILKLIENKSAKVDNLTDSSSLEPVYSSSRTETRENLQDVLASEYIDVSEPKNVSSNSIQFEKENGMKVLEFDNQVFKNS